jgi:hypothetical protein
MLKKIKSNRKGQLHSIEIIICGVLIVTAVAFVSIRPLPPQKTMTCQRLYEIGYSSLEALDKLPNSTDESTLAEYVYNNDTTNLTSYLNKTLPEGVMYSIYLSNAEKEELLYSTDSITGDLSVVVHRIIVLEDPPAAFAGYIGFTYDFRLVMWLG